MSVDINFPKTDLDTQIRDDIPNLLAFEEGKFNKNFFAQVAPFLLKAIAGDKATSTDKIYINSGAPVRWALMEMFMGDRSEQVQSHPVGSLKELQWEDFEKTVKMEGTQEQKLVTYSLLAALSKLVIREYVEGVVGEVASATDTVNYVKIDGKWTKQEKSVNIGEAYEQIELLTSGAEFLVANASVIGKVGDKGEFGMSMWMLPMRYVFKDKDQREAVKLALREKVEEIFASPKPENEVRPGGVSSVDEIWINNLQVGFHDTEEEHEISNVIRDEKFSFDGFLKEGVKWTNLTGDKLTDGKKVGVAAMIIGGPLYGMRRAAVKYVEAVKKNVKHPNFDVIRGWVKSMSSVVGTEG